MDHSMAQPSNQPAKRGSSGPHAKNKSSKLLLIFCFKKFIYFNSRKKFIGLTQILLIKSDLILSIGHVTPN